MQPTHQNGRAAVNGPPAMLGPYGRSPRPCRALAVHLATDREAAVSCDDDR